MRAWTIAIAGVVALLAAAAAFAQPGPPPDLFRAAPDTYAPRYDPDHQPPPPAVAVLPYAIVLDTRAPLQASAPAAARAPAGASRGYLSLIVQPATAQIYVDGFFIGTVEDYAGSPGPLLEAGPHRIELRLAGYETASFDVSIPSGGVVTHRGDLLKPGAAPPPADTSAARGTAAASAARTFYVIPRCYAGDAPPKAENLPKGCRVADVRIVPGSAFADAPQPAHP